MAQRSTVRYDASKGFKKLQAERRRIQRGSEITTKELVALGKRYARQYVPKFTRQTYDSIRGQTKRLVQGARGSIFIELKQRTGDNRTTHDVARYMADGLPTPGHFKSGSRLFMANTKSYLNRIKKEFGNKNIKGGRAPKT